MSSPGKRESNFEHRHWDHPWFGSLHTGRRSRTGATPMRLPVSVGTDRFTPVPASPLWPGDLRLWRCCKPPAHS